MAAAPPPLVGCEAFDPMHSSSSPSSSSSSDHSLVQLELLRTAFATPALFPKLPNLRSLLEEPSIGQRDIANSLFGSKLLHIFSEAGLKSSLGFNQGTRRLSLTLPLIPVHRVETAQQVVLCAMLGLLAQQATLESIYQQQLLQQQEAAEDTQQPQQQTDRLLANACLRLFMEQTCVAVVEKKVNFRLQHVSIAMESAALKLHSAKDRSHLFTDSKRVPFWYCPCYLQLSGYSASEQCFLEERLAVDIERLLQGMMEAFWENVMTEANYYPSPDLKAAVSQGLERYLGSSLSHGNNVNQAARFSPSPSASSSNSNLFRLYLHGGAGTGKSSFVAALRMSLERILRTFLQPDKTCVIVKLPLDFLSPEALAKELLVKGISDWSVERVCEQSLCKGKLVILHLEENPQDPQLQAELLTLLQRMLSALASRYPVESKTNLIQVFTSNFVPIEPISSDPSTAVVLVKPPIAEQQGRICAHMLSELVKRATGASSVNVLLQCAPPIAADMRPIHKWKISISHVIARHLLLLQKSNNKQERKNEEHDVLSDAHIQLLLCSSTSSVSPSASPCSQHKHLLQVLYALQPNSKLLPLASLVSEDAYFFYEESQSTSQAQQEQQENPISPAVDAVLSLTFQKVLTPGVIVLTGPSTSTLPLKDSLLAHIRHHPLIGSEGQAHITEVELREEKDKEKVLGPYWEFPRGGLFKFIDQINNPNSAHRRQHEQEYAIVVAHANRLGQHFLCELLDANRAATHRQAVCKDGVLFVVVVEEGFDVISTIFSRAQVTLRL